jgi:transposase
MSGETIEPTIKRAPAAPGAESAPAAPAAESAPAESAPVAPAVKRGLHSRIAKAYTPSQKAEAVEYASTHGVTAASSKFEISRFSIYDWQRKIAKAAKGEGPSPTSGPAPTEIEATRDREILAEWHKHPGLGPSQIRNQLRRCGIKVAVHTVRRVMEDAG